MVYYPQISVLVVPYRTILGRFPPKKIRVRPVPTPTYPFPKLCWICGFLLTLLLIKINFFLEFSCVCTFCAENDPGTTQKKWQQCFSCLEMYFGGNNHGCQEYSKKMAFYTQADRLMVLWPVSCWQTPRCWANQGI